LEDRRIPLSNNTDQKYEAKREITEELNNLQIHSPFKVEPNFHEERKQQAPRTSGLQSAAMNLSKSRTRSSLAEYPYTPIKVLNQFQTDWKIKARVVKKVRKEWNN